MKYQFLNYFEYLKNIFIIIKIKMNIGGIALIFMIMFLVLWRCTRLLYFEDKNEEFSNHLNISKEIIEVNFS